MCGQLHFPRDFALVIFMADFAGLRTGGPGWLRLAAEKTSSENQLSIINKSEIKPLEWKRYIDDVFSLWDTEREEIDQFILEANRHHLTIKFSAEISDIETNFFFFFFPNAILFTTLTQLTILIILVLTRQIS